MYVCFHEVSESCPPNAPPRDPSIPSSVKSPPQQSLNTRLNHLGSITTLLMAFQTWLSNWLIFSVFRGLQLLYCEVNCLIFWGMCFHFSVSVNTQRLCLWASDFIRREELPEVSLCLMWHWISIYRPTDCLLLVPHGFPTPLMTFSWKVMGMNKKKFQLPILDILETHSLEPYNSYHECSFGIIRSKQQSWWECELNGNGYLQQTYSCRIWIEILDTLHVLGGTV